MPRSSTSFKKRQKELARLEKQRDKAEKRAARKEEKQGGGSNLDDAIDFSASIYDFIPDEYNPELEEEEEAETAAAEKKS